MHQSVMKFYVMCLDICFVRKPPMAVMVPFEFPIKSIRQNNKQMYTVYMYVSIQI